MNSNSLESLVTLCETKLLQPQITETPILIIIIRLFLGSFPTPAK
jgi:hypothetical protein